jgi:hypothetical protein
MRVFIACINAGAAIDAQALAAAAAAAAVVVLSNKAREPVFAPTQLRDLKRFLPQPDEHDNLLESSLALMDPRRVALPSATSKVSAQSEKRQGLLTGRSRFSSVVSCMVGSHATGCCGY